MANIGLFMKKRIKQYGYWAAFSLIAVSGAVMALPNNAYEITYRDDDGNVVGYDSYYCGRNQVGLDWGVKSNNVEYVDLGECSGFTPGDP